jgi:hypothetical protein
VAVSAVDSASSLTDEGWTLFVKNRILIFVIRERPVEIKELKTLM